LLYNLETQEVCSPINLKFVPAQIIPALLKC
jgi:hypothetical protein